LIRVKALQELTDAVNSNEDELLQHNIYELYKTKQVVGKPSRDELWERLREERETKVDYGNFFGVTLIPPDNSFCC